MGVGFEPTIPCGIPVFETSALDQLCDPTQTLPQSFSAPGGTRTPNRLDRNQVFYPLNYGRNRRILPRTLVRGKVSLPQTLIRGKLCFHLNGGDFLKENVFVNFRPSYPLTLLVEFLGMARIEQPYF